MEGGCVEGWGQATAAGDGGGRQREGAVILILGAGWPP